MLLLPHILLLTQYSELSTQYLDANAAAIAAIKTQFGVAADDDIADTKPLSAVYEAADWRLIVDDFLGTKPTFAIAEIAADFANCALQRPFSLRQRLEPVTT